MNNIKKTNDSPMSSINNLTKFKDKTSSVRQKIHHIMENTFSSRKDLFQPSESLTEIKILE